MKKWKESTLDEKVERLRWFSVYDSFMMLLIGVALLLLVAT